MKNVATQVESPGNPHSWKSRLALLTALLLAATLPFWLGHLDIHASSLFYVPQPLGTPYEWSWPLAQKPALHWLFVVGSDLPWLSIAALLPTFALPGLRRNRLVKRSVILLLLTLVLGPGLLVNGIAKNYSGRPRPRDVAEFNGNQHYLPPLAIGTPGAGKSFPCGHCSVGFAVGAVGLAVIETDRAIGIGVIVFSLLFGSAIGVARMADGAHFLSDVLWAALLTWLGMTGAKGLLDWWESRDAASQSRARWLPPAMVGLALLVMVAGLLFALPFDQTVATSLDENASAKRLVLELDDANLQIRIDPQQRERLRLSGEVKGFGSLNLHIVSRAFTSKDGDEWRYSVARHGKASEVEAPMLLSVRPETLSQLHVRIRHGHADVLAGPGTSPDALKIETNGESVSIDAAR